MIGFALRGAFMLMLLLEVSTLWSVRSLNRVLCLLLLLLLLLLLFALQHERDFAGHTQRCELYVAFLGDLLLCHPSMLRREMAKQQLQQQQQLEEQQEQQQGWEATATAAGECLLDLLWKVVTATEAATKRLQSFALRVLMKLLLLGLVLQQQQQRHQQLHQEQQQQEQQQQEHQQAILAARLEVLLEALYLQPVLQHQYREHEKYVRS